MSVFSAFTVVLAVGGCPPPPPLVQATLELAWTICGGASGAVFLD